MKSLVVPVDGSDVSERAVPVAAALALRTGAEVALLHVVPSDASEEEEQAYLASVVHCFPSSVARRRIVHRTDDLVANAILDEVAAARDPVLLMATHGRTSFGELVFGSVADRVLHDATVPVVLVGPRCGPATDLGGCFVVAVDGSNRDETLVEAAARWSAATSATPVAVHVAVPAGVEVGIAVGVGDHIACDAAEALRRRGCLATDVVVMEANGASGVVQYATDHLATAVLVGHRRRGRIGGFILGSQAHAIVRHARCPVVVVPS